MFVLSVSSDEHSWCCMSAGEMQNMKCVSSTVTVDLTASGILKFSFSISDTWDWCNCSYPILFSCVNNAFIPCRTVDGLYNILLMHCSLGHGGLFFWECIKAKVNFTILFAFLTYF